MKKIILGILVISSLGFATKGYYTRNSVKLTEEKVKEIALKHANASENAVVGKTKLDREHGRYVYEVEIYDGNTEYDYEIDAETGDVVYYSKEMSESITVNSVGFENNKDYLPMEKVMEIIRKRVNGANEKNLVEFHTDIENGRAVYEGKVIVNNKKYDFEVDAKTGEIISWEEKFTIR